MIIVKATSPTMAPTMDAVQIPKAGGLGWAIGVKLTVAVEDTATGSLRWAVAGKLSVAVKAKAVGR